MITKIDLADVVGFERDAAYDAINRVRPGLEVLEVSARTEAGLAPWIDRLHAAMAHVSRDVVSVRLKPDTA